MPFVVDASVAASWLMPDERDPLAVAALHRLSSDQALAPAIWWFEIRNLIVQNERRGRIERTVANDVLAALAQLPVSIDHSPDEDAVIDLARRHGLTIYDAAYIELAGRQRVSLASLDRQMIAAAQGEGVPLFQPH